MNNIRFRNNIIDPNIPQALRIAESLLMAGSNMINEISEKNDFKYNSGDGVQVALQLIRVREPINIYMYRPWSKSSNVVGYFEAGSIFFNLYKLEKFELNSFVGSLLHEYAHYCGFNHKSAFGTSNYKTKDKTLYSVPYFLSENVKRWL